MLKLYNAETLKHETLSFHLIQEINVYFCPILNRSKLSFLEKIHRLVNSASFIVNNPHQLGRNWSPENKRIFITFV